MLKINPIRMTLNQLDDSSLNQVLLLTIVAESLLTKN